MWDNDRYSIRIVTALNTAINKIKKISQSRRIHLVGFSGGGTLAALLAARRHDVFSLRTVSANLDSVRINKHFKIPVFTGSLNAIDIAKDISHIPQIHFIGEQDTIIPDYVTQSFVGKMSRNNCAKIISVKGAHHQRGWLERWKTLLNVKLPCSK